MSPEGPAAPAGRAQVDLDGTYRLSRHLCIRPTADGLEVESILDGSVFRLASPSVFRLFLALAWPVRATDLVSAAGDEGGPAVLRFLERSLARGLVTRVDAGEIADEGSLAHWEPHDLHFHLRSRRGRTRAPVGATYRLRGRIPPEPVERSAPAGPVLALFRPDIERLAREDAPLTRVLEARRSRYDALPLSVRDLGEFLYRTFRVTRVEDGADPSVRKVYPSGGALHSLELYVVAWACHGLERGVYRYRAGEHVLGSVAPFSGLAEHLLSEARAGTGGQLADQPPVLLVLTSRFRRVMWKYEGLAYATVLKEVGALFQTMYLVATAMRLAPCAIGAGDAEAFARLAGLDYFAETSVGEFVLGGAEIPLE